MDDKILKKLKGTINKLALGFENSEGFDGHGKPHAVEGKLFVKTDSGVAFVFELDLTKKGKAHGEMCILHEDEDGDLVDGDQLLYALAVDHVEQQTLEGKL